MSQLRLSIFWRSLPAAASHIRHRRGHILFSGVVTPLTKITLASSSSFCILWAGDRQTGKAKLPTVEMRGLVHLTHPQIRKGRREMETQRETERCRVGPFLAVRSGAPQLLVWQLRKSQGGDYQGKQLMSLRAPDALPCTQRHCWPHLQGGVTPPPPQNGRLPIS